MILGPNLGSYSRGLGLHLSYPMMVGVTLVMGMVCIVGAIISYRSARAKVDRDLADIADLG